LSSYRFAMSTVVSQPSLSGTDESLVSRPDAGPEAATPATVNTIQPMTTRRL